MFNSLWNCTDMFRYTVKLSNLRLVTFLKYPFNLHLRLAEVGEVGQTFPRRSRLWRQLPTCGNCNRKENHHASACGMLCLKGRKGHFDCDCCKHWLCNCVWAQYQRHKDEKNLGDTVSTDSTTLTFHLSAGSNSFSPRQLRLRHLMRMHCKCV